MKKVLFIGFLMLFAFAQFAFATELLTNEGFENWTVNGATGPPDDWNLSGTSITGSQETTNVHGGTYSTNITWTTTSTRYLRQQAVPVTEGTNYLFTFWALDNDPDGRVRVAIRWYDAGSGFVSGYYGDYSADSPDWQQMSSGLQAAPATAVTADIEIRVYDVSGWDGEATVYVDDVEVGQWYSAGSNSEKKIRDEFFLIPESFTKGKSKINLLSDGVRFLLIMMKISVFFNPLRIFLPVSILFFFIGIGQRLTNVVAMAARSLRSNGYFISLICSNIGSSSLNSSIRGLGSYSFTRSNSLRFCGELAIITPLFGAFSPHFSIIELKSE